ncbi:ion transporter [bacterium]|nr:MAG: ion transporter [bacterium]
MEAVSLGGDVKAASEFKRHVWNLLEVTEDPDTGRVDWGWVDFILLVLIVLSILAVILETIQGLSLRYGRAFYVFEVFTVVVFTIEYIARLWSCTVDERYREPFRGRVRYASSFYGVIDALAVAPFYAALLLPVAVMDLRFLRILRLMRFARVLKIGRYSEALNRLKSVFHAKRADLGVALFGVCVILVLASSVMYHVENPAQPEAFSSIPAAMWWGVSALTTVGYGDIQPITPLGKTLGGLIQILGIAMFALPAGILAAGYEDESRRKRAGAGYCDRCGQPLDEAHRNPPSE